MTLFSAAGDITTAENSAKWSLEKGEEIKKATMRWRERKERTQAALTGIAVKMVLLGRLSRKRMLVIWNLQSLSSGISR